MSFSKVWMIYSNHCLLQTYEWNNSIMSPSNLWVTYTKQYHFRTYGWHKVHNATFKILVTSAKCHFKTHRWHAPHIFLMLMDNMFHIVVSNLMEDMHNSHFQVYKWHNPLKLIFNLMDDVYKNENNSLFKVIDGIQRTMSLVNLWMTYIPSSLFQQIVEIRPAMPFSNIWMACATQFSF